MLTNKQSCFSSTSSAENSNTTNSVTYHIDSTRFNDPAYIESRVTMVPVSDRGSLRTALNYLYQDYGPINLPRARLLAADPHFEPAERIVIRWLYTRTSGNLRSEYGSDSLRAARFSRYRCEVCGFQDVRVLNLDHVNGRVTDTPFACLCANCHTIKSRESDWTGEKPLAPQTITEAEQGEAGKPPLAALSAKSPVI